MESQLSSPAPEVAPAPWPSAADPVTLSVYVMCRQDRCYTTSSEMPTAEARHESLLWAPLRRDAEAKARKDVEEDARAELAERAARAGMAPGEREEVRA